MAKGIMRKLDLVLDNIAYRMRPTPGESIYASGMRGEGYLGGYRQAIRDVTLALNGVHPRTRGLWDVPDPPEVNDGMD